MNDLAGARLDRLAGFLSDFRGLEADRELHSLQSFLWEWSASPKPNRPGVRTIDHDRFAAFLSNVTGPLEEFRANGSFLNPWVVAGLRRSEVRNAAVLANLWRPELSGASALEFLNNFLRRVEYRAGVALPDAETLASGYRVRTEHCLAGQASERVDLTIEGRGFIIGVEIKIDAAEGEAQLERYGHALDERGRLKRLAPFLIFLAPYPHRGEAGPEVGLPILDASWDDVKAAGELLLEGNGSYNFTAELIGRFALHIATF